MWGCPTHMGKTAPSTMPLCVPHPTGHAPKKWMGEGMFGLVGDARRDAWEDVMWDAGMRRGMDEVTFALMGDARRDAWQDVMWDTGLGCRGGCLGGCLV